MRPRDFDAAGGPCGRRRPLLRTAHDGEVTRADRHRDPHRCNTARSTSARTGFTVGFMPHAGQVSLTWESTARAATVAARETALCACTAAPAVSTRSALAPGGVPETCTTAATTPSVMSAAGSRAAAARAT